MDVRKRKDTVTFVTDGSGEGLHRRTGGRARAPLGEVELDGARWHWVGGIGQWVSRR